MNASSLLTWVTCFSHQRSWTFLGTFKDSCELQARIHTISTYILRLQAEKVSNWKKVGAPKKISGDLLRKKALTNLFTYFPGFPRALDWRFCSTRPDWISLDTNFGLEIRTCYSTASSHSRAQSNHQLFRLNVIFCMIYCTTLIVFSIASLVFSINYNLFFSTSIDSYQKMTAS